MPCVDSDAELLALLERVRSVAVVGASPRSSRPSHQVAAYLSEATDWQVWFVNPAAGSVLGQPTIPSLADLPAVPDLVDVFRRPEHLPGVVEAAIDVGASAVWFQLGLRHEAAAQRAVRAGLHVVQDRCLKIEHQRGEGDRFRVAGPHPASD